MDTVLWLYPPATGLPAQAAVRWLVVSDVDDLDPRLLGSVTVVVLRSGPKLDARRIGRLPGLRRVVRAGSGVDNIDLAELARRGIEFVRQPVPSAPAVAELGLAALVLLARRVVQAHAMVRDGTAFDRSLLGDSVADLEVAVWGGGPIGRASAALIQPVVSQVRFVSHPSLPAELPSVSRARACAGADVHVLALPLTEATRALIDSSWCAAVAERRPYLINLARSGLVSWPALGRALAADGLRGVFLEPLDPSDLPAARELLERHPHANLLLSQHLGACRTDIRQSLDSWAVAAALAG